MISSYDAILIEQIRDELESMGAISGYYAAASDAMAFKVNDKRDKDTLYVTIEQLKKTINILTIDKDHGGVKMHIESDLLIESAKRNNWNLNSQLWSFQQAKDVFEAINSQEWVENDFGVPKAKIARYLAIESVLKSLPEEFSPSLSPTSEYALLDIDINEIVKYMALGAEAADIESYMELPASYLEKLFGSI